MLFHPFTGERSCRRCDYVEQVPWTPYAEWLYLLRRFAPHLSASLPSVAYVESCKLAGVEEIERATPTEAAMLVLPGLRKRWLNE